MTDDAIDMTDADGQQWTRTGRYRMACWRIDELTAQLSASDAARFAAENLAAEMAGLVREARAMMHYLMLDPENAVTPVDQACYDWLARTAPKEPEHG